MEDLQKESNFFQTIKDKHPANIINDLDGLVKIYPRQWSEVKSELAELIKKGEIKNLNDYLVSKYKSGHKQNTNKKNNQKPNQETPNDLVKAQMTYLALKKYCHTMLTKDETQKEKLSFCNFIILKYFLFSRGFEFPVKYGRFLFFWRLVSQRGAVLSIIRKRGIYCIYSQELIDELKNVINGQPVLEIASGLGLLSKFLKKEEISIQPTDDYSWVQHFKYPKAVERIDAKKALKKYQPKVVICSWPPPGNDFEKYVFNTESVDKYIVVSSKHRFGSGDWETYLKQTKFKLEERDDIAKFLLPPELDNQVYIFTRMI